MKKLLVLLILVGLLLCSGCMNQDMIDMLNKPASEMTVMEWMILK